MKKICDMYEQSCFIGAGTFQLYFLVVMDRKIYKAQIIGNLSNLRLSTGVRATGMH
jgi:hypothetical protein